MVLNYLFFVWSFLDPVITQNNFEVAELYSFRSKLYTQVLIKMKIIQKLFVLGQLPA